MISPVPPWPYFEADEREAALAVLASGRVNYWTGEEGRLFEQEYAEACGRRFGIALANGSVALELALKCLGIGAGDEVVVTPRSFVASASGVVLADARPVFADVDPDSQNITAATIERALTPHTRAVIAVHLEGWPCEMDPLLELAAAHGLKLIEDCAQAHGATYKRRPVGAFGDVACFSFCQDKIITTGGEGGLLLTDDEALWRRAWSYKDHGKSFEAAFRRNHEVGFRWLHESFGTNWRMTEMQAAIGRVQLRKLPAWLDRRRRNAAILDERLRGLSALRVPHPPLEIGHAYYKFTLFVRPERLRPGWSRDRLMAEVAARGVPCRSGSCPEIYREKAFREAGLGPLERLLVAQELGETSLMLLVHPTLDDEAMQEMADVVTAATL